MITTSLQHYLYISEPLPSLGGFIFGFGSVSARRCAIGRTATCCLLGGRILAAGIILGAAARQLAGQWGPTLGATSQEQASRTAEAQGSQHFRPIPERVRKLRLKRPRGSDEHFTRLRRCSPDELGSAGTAKKKLINRQCCHIEYPPHLRTKCAGQDYVKSVGKK